MMNNNSILKRQTGGEIPLKFDRPLKLEEIPTKNKIHVINNYSPNYDYIVEGDKMYYALKGKNHWVDISDNDKARANLYDFLGNNYDFKGYEDDEKNIWNQIKQGKFNYQQYREGRNKPQPVKQPVQSKQPTQQPEKLVTVRVGTAGGGFMNVQVPEYMTEKKGLMPKVKTEYLGEATAIAQNKNPERYADPINNAGNWLPFAILTGGRGLENMGFKFISPLVDRMIKGASNVGSKVASSVGNLASNISKTVTGAGGNVARNVGKAIYSTPAKRAITNTTAALTTLGITAPMVAPHLKVDNSDNSDYKAVWNMAMDGDIKEAFGTGWSGLQRKWQKKFGGESADMPSSLNLPQSANDSTSMYAIRPTSFVGDTVFVPKSRQYILPESLDMNEFTFKHRNRGQNTPIESEAAPITAFTPFVPYGQQGSRHKTFIGYNAETGQLKAGDISQFGPGDFLSGTFSNDFTGFKKDASGKIIYKRDGAHGNGNRSVPLMTTTSGKDGSLNILTDTNQKGNTYGYVSGGRALVRVGDELRLLSGSIEDIERAFEEMKKRNNATYGTFYTLDNGSYNRGLRTVDGKFTTADLQKYDSQNRGNSGNFLYITGKNNPVPKFRSDTIFTPNIRTVNSESYKKGYPLTNEQKGVVLHHTAFMEPDLTGVVNHLTNPKNEASAHVVIGFDGARKVLATPDKVTFHAGYSAHEGRENVNDFMIGIEFQGDTNRKDLTPQQIESAIEYLEPIIRKNNIRLEDIVTHQNVRDLYNDYARKAGQKEAPSKPDINQRNYNLILQALLKKVYYKK